MTRDFGLYRLEIWVWRRPKQAMYTFGAPAASRSAMPDLNQADHCFRGLRTYTAASSGGMGPRSPTSSLDVRLVEFLSVLPEPSNG